MTERTSIKDQILAEDNIEKIHRLYEAFGSGDVQAVLDQLSDHVDWAIETSSTAAPWYGVRHGKEGVASFIQAFGSAMQLQEFNPYAFAANDDQVHTLVHCRATSGATGKAINQYLHHYFRFDDGKICFYRGTEDTAQTEAALRS
jgi:uncharacterized protein